MTDGKDYRKRKTRLLPKPIIIAVLILAAMIASLYLGIKSVDWLPSERYGAVTGKYVEGEPDRGL